MTIDNLHESCVDAACKARVAFDLRAEYLDRKRVDFVNDLYGMWVGDRHGRHPDMHWAT